MFAAFYHYVVMLYSIKLTSCYFYVNLRNFGRVVAPINVEIFQIMPNVQLSRYQITLSLDTNKSQLNFIRIVLFWTLVL